jgi:hypothetical protein
MAEIRFVDTSVLCDLLKVPGKCQRHDEVREELEVLRGSGVQLVLPIASVIETGNHIAQAEGGRARRACAERFVGLLRLTAEGGAPWVLHSVAWDGRMLDLLCDGPGQVGAFVEMAGSGTLGAGDVAILAECELYASRTAGVRVSVWTHDERLAAYT